MRVSIIAAMDEEQGIGKDNDLLFRIKEDFKRMRELTMGHPIIMGRRTFYSIGRVLPGRTNIIISRNPDNLQNTEDAVYAENLEKAIEIAKESIGNDEIFIFGGGMIFREALEKSLINRLYLTIVEGDYGADTFFPEYPEFKKVVSEEKREADGYKYTFLTLEK